jgi:hypothetical protein
MLPAGFTHLPQIIPNLAIAIDATTLQPALFDLTKEALI